MERIIKLSVFMFNIFFWRSILLWIVVARHNQRGHGQRNESRKNKIAGLFHMVSDIL